MTLFVHLFGLFVCIAASTDFGNVDEVDGAPEITEKYDTYFSNPSIHYRTFCLFCVLEKIFVREGPFLDCLGNQNIHLKFVSEE